MTRTRVRASARVRALTLVVGFTLSFGTLGPVLADHGNDHAPHTGWPTRPHGRTQIENTFGQPCATNNSQVNDTTIHTRAADDGKTYVVRAHRELGPLGYSNAITSVYWHIYNEGGSPHQKHGIYGYTCKKISGQNNYSTHSWGIAVDTNTSPNHQWLRHCHAPHDLHAKVRNPYITHNFAEISCDAGHFQYATGY